MAKRESLQAYQDKILEKMEEARMSDSGQIELLFGFRSADKNFLIGGKNISQLATPSVLEPIPVSKTWAVGAANIKGSVYSITDFSLLMGGKPTKKGKFMVLGQDIMVGSAILIESLTGLYELKNIGVAIEDPLVNDMAVWITASYEIAGERHYMVDAALLSADTKFSKLQSGDI